MNEPMAAAEFDVCPNCESTKDIDKELCEICQAEFDRDCEEMSDEHKI